MLFRVPVAVFVGADALDLFERAGEVPAVGVADKLGDLADLEAGIRKQFSGPANADVGQKVVKALVRVAVDELGQAPLRDVAVVRHVL